MSVCVVVGTVATADGAYMLRGGLRGPVREVGRFRAADYRGSQTRVAVDLEHHPIWRVGKLLYLERRSHDAPLVAVAEVNTDQVAEGAWWFSPALRSREDGSDIVLTSLALTRCPGTVALQPVTVYPGELHMAVWKLEDSEAGEAGQVLRRARDYTKGRSMADTILIHDIAQQRWLQQQNERSSLRPVQLLGRPVPPQLSPTWRPGMVEWSQTPGKILRVD